MSELVLEQKKKYRRFFPVGKLTINGQSQKKYYLDENFIGQNFWIDLNSVEMLMNFK